MIILPSKVRRGISENTTLAENNWSIRKYVCDVEHTVNI